MNQERKLYERPIIYCTGEQNCQCERCNPMTPQEQQASDLLHTKLGVKPSGEVVKRSASPHEAELSRSGPSAFYSPTQNVIVLTKVCYGADEQVVSLTPEQFTALEAFAVKIGWRCS